MLVSRRPPLQHHSRPLSTNDDEHAPNSIVLDYWSPSSGLSRATPRVYWTMDVARPVRKFICTFEELAVSDRFVSTWDGARQRACIRTVRLRLFTENLGDRSEADATTYQQLLASIVCQAAVVPTSTPPPRFDSAKRTETAGTRSVGADPGSCNNVKRPPRGTEHFGNEGKDHAPHRELFESPRFLNGALVFEFDDELFRPVFSGTVRYTVISIDPALSYVYQVAESQVADGAEHPSSSNVLLQYDGALFTTSHEA